MPKVTNAEVLAYDVCAHMDDLARLDGKDIHHNPANFVDLTAALDGEDSPYANRSLDAPNARGCVPSKNIAPVLKK